MRERVGCVGGVGVRRQDKEEGKLKFSVDLIKSSTGQLRGLRKEGKSRCREWERGVHCRERERGRK